MRDAVVALVRNECHVRQQEAERALMQRSKPIVAITSIGSVVAVASARCTSELGSRNIESAAMCIGVCSCRFSAEMRLPKANVEQIAREWLDVDALGLPHEVQVHLLAHNYLALLDALHVQRARRCR